MAEEITQIKKRDGTISPFYKKKIAKAIYRAACATATTLDYDKLADAVHDELYAVYDGHTTPSVEQVQDIVEKVLMQSEYPQVAKAYILYRQERTRLRLKKGEIPKTVKLLAENSKQYFRNALAEFVYYRTYSRWIDAEKRRETWIETVNRYMSYMRKKLDTKLTDAEYDEVGYAILNMEVMPSMRLLWAAGDAADKTNVCAYNCSYTIPTTWKSFGEIMYLSMCGTGVGFSVERKFVDELPVIQKQTGEKLPTHVIDDSKEGWADALVLGMKTWADGKDVDFDYANLRPRGARLKVMGGQSSGPEPLRAAINFTREKMLSLHGSKLTPIQVHDIICKIGEVVVMGGVRRSALISLSDLNDLEMRNAKTGSFYVNEPQRSMANNSAVYEHKPTSIELLEEWLALAKSGSGERGIFNRGGLRSQMPARRLAACESILDKMGTNPCFAAGTMIHTKDGDFPIEQLVGKTVSVWDGNGWISIDNFRVTGKDKRVLRVFLRSGEYLRATPEHTFILDDGRRVLAKNLKWGQRLAISTAPNQPVRDNRDFNQIISVSLDGVESKVYCCTVPTTHSFALSCGVLCGNCGEIVLRPNSFCNLTEVVARSSDTLEDLIRKVRLATILGTYQSTLTYFPYLSETWKQNCDEERLLGVSITGQWDCPAVLEEETLSQMKKVAIATNEEYAKRFGINKSASITTVKPSGTCSLVTDASSGMHPRHAQYYIRRIRISATDSLFKMLRDQKVPFLPEVGQSEDTASTYVIEFPVKAPESTVVFNHDLSAIRQLEHWARVKANYTEHNPSITVSVGDNEWIEVVDWLYKNWEITGGLSFLPRNNYIYPLAPYEAITKERYDELVKNFPRIDFSQILLYEKVDETEGAKELACAGGSCELK